MGHKINEVIDYLNGNEYGISFDEVDYETFKSYRSNSKFNRIGIIRMLGTYNNNNITDWIFYPNITYANTNNPIVTRIGTFDSNNIIEIKFSMVRLDTIGDNDSVTLITRKITFDMVHDTITTSQNNENIPVTGFKFFISTF